MNKCNTEILIINQKYIYIMRLCIYKNYRNKSIYINIIEIKVKPPVTALFYFFQSLKYIFNYKIIIK